MLRMQAGLKAPYCRIGVSFTSGEGSTTKKPPGSRARGQVECDRELAERDGTFLDRDSGYTTKYIGQNRAIC